MSVISAENCHKIVKMFFLFFTVGEKRLKRLRVFSDDEDDEPQEKPAKAKGIFLFNKHLCHVLVISSYILYLIPAKVLKHVIRY